jgi:hypothetical protein
MTTRTPSEAAVLHHAEAPPGGDLRLRNRQPPPKGQAKPILSPEPKLFENSMKGSLDLRPEKAINYDELDPKVVKLCRTINDGFAFGGLFTISSCEGHEEPGHQRDGHEWHVLFQLEVDEDSRPTVEAWMSLEFVSWCMRNWWEQNCHLDVWARAPHLNTPGQDIRFSIEGVRPVEPDELADNLTEMWHQIGEGAIWDTPEGKALLGEDE